MSFENKIDRTEIYMLEVITIGSGVSFLILSILFLKLCVYVCGVCMCVCVYCLFNNMEDVIYRKQIYIASNYAHFSQHGKN